MKTEVWNGHKIRFVEITGEWWAVAKDVASALNYAIPHKAIRTHCKGVLKRNIPTVGGSQMALIIPETDIYRLAFRSEKPEAEAFQDWVCGILKMLRQASGLEGFQVFRMLDKEHQKEAMQRLNNGIGNPVRVDFIKANTIANKAVSSMHGHPKMIKKDAMTPEMLVDRQGILDETVELMTFNEKYGLGLSVSDQVYARTTGKIAI